MREMSREKFVMKLPPVFLHSHTLRNPKPFFERREKIQKLNKNDDSKKKRERSALYLYIRHTLREIERKRMTTTGGSTTVRPSTAAPDILAAAEAAGVYDKNVKDYDDDGGKKEGEDDEEEDGYEFGDEETAMARKLLAKDEQRRNGGGDSSSSSEWSSSEDDDDAEILDAAELPNWLKDIKETGREREKADEEDVDATNISPPRTKNEIVNHVPEMPDVPEIGAEEEIELVGQIVSVVGDVCVVASEKEDQAPLDETTPLCSEERFGLGFVEEVFGPITKPMYTMRYDKKKCKSANAPEKMTVGVKIFCVRSMKKTLMPEKLYSKGYDNSGANDEEIDDDGEFSDDEAEAEAKRKKNPKQRKRKEKEGGGGVSASKLWEGFVPKHQLPGHQHQQPIQPPIGQMAFMGGMNVGAPAPGMMMMMQQPQIPPQMVVSQQSGVLRVPVPGVDFIPPPGDSVNAPPPPPPPK
jgi:H/ACA ribonucleoprotein complex non-core subunit NAF1